MPLQGIAVFLDNLRTLAFGGIGVAYAQIGAAFANPVRTIRIVNNTDGDLFFSDDGVNDKWLVPSNSFVLYDYTSNSNSGEGSLVFPIGTAIWVRRSTIPTTGMVAVECSYTTN